jgi:hypothetical protein
MMLYEATFIIDTCLFGELEELSQCSSSHIQSPAFTDDEFPEPVRSHPEKDLKRKRVLNWQRALDDMFKGYHIAQAKNWQLEEGRRSETGFLGRHNLLCDNRLIMPKGTSPEKHIKALLKAGYEKIVIK